jgi:hypothetical protein
MRIRVCADSAGPGRAGKVGPGGTVHFYVAGQSGVDRTLCGQTVGPDYDTDYDAVFTIASEAGTKVYECPRCRELRSQLR